MKVHMEARGIQISLKMELQAAVSYIQHGAENQTGFSGRAAFALNFWAISSTLSYLLLNDSI
ncbi:mCG148242 [Mus musculus]|jgi:hypothetical protein|nr:mCG148242 [Mus musculus]